MGSDPRTGRVWTTWQAGMADLNDGTVRDSTHYFGDGDPYGNGTLVPSDHWGKGCPEDCDVHRADEGSE